MDSIKISNNEITFCQLTEAEYASIYYDKMKSVGWRPIADSMKAHAILAKNSLFALKHNNTIIATLSAAKSPAFGIAYLAFFTVDKPWRGLNLDKYLRKKATALLTQEGYTIEFDSPKELLPYYSRAGYKVITMGAIYALKIAKHCHTIDVNIREIDENNIAQVIAYDNSIIPNPNRKDYLQAWLNKKHTQALCYKHNDSIIGYGVMSKHIASDSDTHTDSYIIAPVYAKNSAVAIALIQALCKRADSNEPIYLDALHFNPDTTGVIRTLGFEEVFPFIRMSTSGNFDEKRKEALSQVYALSSHAYAPL